VSDMRTPGGVDGADVHAWVVQYRPDLASRVVLITGDIADEQTVTKLRKTGVPWVEKPFGVQQLISVVQQTMGKALLLKICAFASWSWMTSRASGNFVRLLGRAWASFVWKLMAAIRHWHCSRSSP